MRVALTGATGFLGRAVAAHLLQQGHEVAALIRPDSRIENLKNSACVHLIGYTSLLSPSVVDALKQWQPDAMIHLAWKGVSSGERSGAHHFTENLPFTLDSIVLAHGAGCRQWIGTGSQAEYGIANRKLSEDDSCHPVTAYGKAKLATGIAALGLCETLKIKGTWARVFSVYGPGDHLQTFISYLIQCFVQNEVPSLSTCRQKWDYLYITDAAAAITSLVEKQGTGIYNIGSGETVVLREVAETIKTQMGVKTSVGYGLKLDGPLLHLEADITRLQKQTGWQPKVSLADGLAKTIQSFQNKIIHESL
jgi:nucleoside-diphosphate-sugar epimerase